MFISSSFSTRQGYKILEFICEGELYDTQMWEEVRNVYKFYSESHENVFVMIFASSLIWPTFIAPHFTLSKMKCTGKNEFYLEIL
jgi:hypothetical protein